MRQPSTRNRNSTLIANDLRKMGNDMLRFAKQLEIEVHDDRAAVAQLQSSSDGFSFVRRNGLWFMVPAVSEISDPQYVEDVVRQLTMTAAAFDAGTEAVLAGKARTVEAVNAIVRERLPKARDFDGTASKP